MWISWVNTVHYEESSIKKEMNGEFKKSTIMGEQKEEKHMQSESNTC